MMRPLASACVLVLSASLPAHGGQYRGSGTPGAPPPGRGIPVGPTTGGPAAPTPGVGTPSTGGASVSPEEVSWQAWWELNKDPFVQQDTSGRQGPVTGSDDFYLGVRRSEPVVDTLEPTAADLVDRIVPGLAALMTKERNRDVQTACLMALAKIGRDGPGVDLQQELLARLPRGDQEVRETAVLALGVAGRKTAMPKLLAVLGDTAEGRKLCARDDVDPRTRAFAAYAVGVLARSLDDAAARQEAHDGLLAILRDDDLKNRDLRVAAVTGLGLLSDPGQGTQRRLAWLTVEELLAWYQRDRGAGDEAVQSHAPIAIGRLLGRGDSQLHQRCKQHFVGVLSSSTKRGNSILQSAALALGMLALPSEECSDDAAVEKALQAYFENGVDRLARSLAAMSLGRIGGAANRTWLLSAYQRANKNTERPWIALSLGLIAAEAARRGESDSMLATMLLEDLAAASRPDVQGALAVAIGLTRHASALPAMQRMLRDSEHQEVLAGHLCVGIGLLGDRSAAPALSAVLERSQRRPFLLLQTAVALGCLGDRDANERLLVMLRASESVAVAAALANAIGRIGDRRAIDPLLTMASDEELPKLARAFVAAALGGIGDRSPLPWNAPLSRDANWGAPVDTLSNGATGVLDIL